MKTAVIYKSKSGFTKKYAQWIAEELSADIFDASAVGIKALEAYDTIIYGGGLHAVGIMGVKFITKNLDRLEGKKIVVYATGASPGREDIINEVRDKNLTSEEQKTVKFFYLRGGFDINKLPAFEKIAMSFFKKQIQKKEELTADERDMLAAYGNPVDFTEKSNIAELIAYVNAE